MAKRLFDIVGAVLGLLIATPIVAIAAAGIWLTSRGPIFYQAQRVGRFGRGFKMYKLRSMHVAADSGSAITAEADPRVFPVGRCIRATKIDELPQLWNVLIGQMSIVGPRPEDPGIVADHYTQIDRETLLVRPGLTSPGSIYNYTHGETLIDSSAPERCYVDRLLPIKLSMERVYVRKTSLGYDLSLIARTVWVLLRKATGQVQFAEPPEMRMVLAESAAKPSIVVHSPQ
ncbi:UNVERIFIED_CONTAM: hypothetical protein GTU68_014616 [Idotea baltica]|nr:hypothetical protein [Idotea baltica]